MILGPLTPNLVPPQLEEIIRDISLCAKVSVTVAAIHARDAEGGPTKMVPVLANDGKRTIT